MVAPCTGLILKIRSMPKMTACFNIFDSYVNDSNSVSPFEFDMVLVFFLVRVEKKI